MADERLMIGWQVAECRSPCAEPANMQRLAESQAGRYVMLCLEGCLVEVLLHLCKGSHRQFVGSSKLLFAAVTARCASLSDSLFFFGRRSHGRLRT